MEQHGLLLLEVVKNQGNRKHSRMSPMEITPLLQSEIREPSSPQQMEPHGLIEHLQVFQLLSMELPTGIVLSLQ